MGDSQLPAILGIAVSLGMAWMVGEFGAESIPFGSGELTKQNGQLICLGCAGIIALINAYGTYQNMKLEM